MIEITNNFDNQESFNDDIAIKKSTAYNNLVKNSPHFLTFYFKKHISIDKYDILLLENIGFPKLL